MNKQFYLLVFLSIIFLSCNNLTDNKAIKEEVFKTEKAFEKMTSDSSISIAFYTFAAQNAVILRENDSIIRGIDAIRNYYQNHHNSNAIVTWTPDQIEISDDGTMASSYGKYCWKLKQSDGSVKEFKGIFHTIWKKQKDGSWKYIWD